MLPQIKFINKQDASVPEISTDRLEFLNLERKYLSKYFHNAGDFKL